MRAPRPFFPPQFDVDAWSSAVVRGQQDSTHVDTLLASLSDLQHDVVGRRQLLLVGVGEGQARARLRSGHLHVIPGRPGVYAVGRPTLTPAGHRMAAVLAAGRGARLAGWSGCTQRAVLPEAGRSVDLAIPRERRLVLPALTVLRTTVREGEVTVCDGIPTHSMARLLLDLARRGDEELLEWAWRQAIYTKQLDLGDVWRLLTEHDREEGTPAVRRLYRRRRELVGALRSRFEVLMLGIIREAGLPEPLCNAPWEVRPGLLLRPDFRIPELGLVVEADGRDGHEDVEFLLSDAERDALFSANGHITRRFSFWEAERQRQRVIAELRAAAAGDAWSPVVAGRR